MPDKVLLEAGPAVAGRSRAHVAPRGADDRDPGQLRRAASRCSKSFTTAAPGTTATARTSKIARATTCRWPSRMLSIVDAFDSMTTDHVYRPARSRERALAELFECAGSQFDPELVRQFSELFSQDQNLLTEKLARRWLQRLPQRRRRAAVEQVVEYERPAVAVDSHAVAVREEADRQHARRRACSSTASRRSCLWNTGVERLTGVSSARRLRPHVPAEPDGHVQQPRAADRQRRLPGGPRDRDRRPMARPREHHGPAGPARGGRSARDSRPQQRRRRSTARPCCCTTCRRETSLEEKCQALHAQVAKDPMTQVANRAEFDRMLNNFVAAHQESNLPCSLIMCDIDHFKSINDTYGHQAGDAAIITFASLLKSMCRSGDLVARYGGEEFAILCADCTNAAAARKAEAIRKALADVKHTCLGNKSITASFGVTELQTGDTPETMLRRADRALLQAKDQGRNQVVQLGDGMMEEKREAKLVAVPVAGAAARWSKRRS